MEAIMHRQETRPIYVGNIQIGGQNRCVLQSMTNVPAKNIEAGSFTVKNKS